MNRSLSWFDDDALRKLFSGAGAHVRSRRGLRGRTVITVAGSGVPSTLVGQFGHANRFAASEHAGYGRFASAASTQPGPPDVGALPIIVEGGAPITPEAPFDPKGTRLAAGTSPPPEERVDEAPAWVSSYDATPAIFQPPSGASIEEKVESYLDWAMRVCGASAGFVADRQGLLLGWRAASADGLDELGAICAALEQGFARLESDALNAPAGHAVIERERRRVLIVWAESGVGRLYAGLSAASLPPQAAMLFAAEAFRALVEGES